MVTSCLKASIDQQKDWVDCLRSIAMAYRAGVHASTGKSPYKVMFGLRMHMPVHLLTKPYDDVNRDPDSDEEVEIKEDTRPYEDIFSELGKVRELIHKSCSVNISTSQARQAKDYDAHHRGAPLKVGDLIMNFNTRTAQRKGDRLAPKWTGPYTIIKVHKNGNYSVKNSKGEALTTKMSASNVKLWQEPTNWENEPAPDWISAQNRDVSEPTILAALADKGSKWKGLIKQDCVEPWLPGPTFNSDNSSSEDSDYEGDPPVKKVELSVSSSRQKILTKKRPHHEDSACESPTKKVWFLDNSEPSSVLPDGDLQKVHSAVKKVAKKRTLAEQRERKTAMRMKEKSKKDDFFSQMLQVQNVEKTADLNNPEPSVLPDLLSDTDSDLAITDVKEGNSFKFIPLLVIQRKAVCQRIGLEMRKTNMAHSQVGENLESRVPRVTRVKGDGNCLFRALALATTGWEIGHLKIQDLVCDHIHDVRPYNSKDASDGPLYLRQTRMRKETIFGTDVELFSAAQVLSIDIYVFHKYRESMKWLYFPCVHGSGNWKNAIYLNNHTGNGMTGHFDYVTGLC